MNSKNVNKVQKAIEFLNETTNLKDVSEKTGLKKETITLLMESDSEMIERVIESFLDEEGYLVEETFVNELKRTIELRDKYSSDQRTRIEGAMEVGRRMGREIGGEQMKIKVAKSLLAENWSLEEIAYYTKLEMDVLKKLKDECN